MSTEFCNAMTDWDLVRTALANRPRVFISGPPGTGKTYAALNHELEGRDAYPITLTPETPAAEVRGMYMPKGGEFVWTDGVFVRAMREGARLVINEISHASEDVLALLYPILESAETAQLTLPSGETLTPAPGFQVVVTDNYDMEALSDALRSRLSTQVEVRKPHPEALKRVDPRYRDAAERSFEIPFNDPRAVTLRAWIAITELIEANVEEQTAFCLTFGRARGQMVWEASRIAGADKVLEAAGAEITGGGF